MLIELITPLMLASSPMTVTVDSHEKYSHAQQAVVSQDGAISAFPTYGATQTYSGNGRPSDNDND